MRDVFIAKVINQVASTVLHVSTLQLKSFFSFLIHTTFAECIDTDCK
jgi:hypothetical protein